MNIIAFGVNHKNTPIEIREKLFLNATQQSLLLSELRNNPAVAEACVLSTCNRVEIYAHVLDVGIDLHQVIALILKIKNISFSPEFDKYFYSYFGQAAIRHLLEVSAGLDSLILGEEQILGQVKAAFAKSREMGMLNRHFNILSNIAIRTGKKARSETKINFGGSSVSWAAIVKAEEVLGALRTRSILVIGAGKMSELAVGHIQNIQFKKSACAMTSERFSSTSGNYKNFLKCKKLYLMNRTLDNAKGLAKKYGGEVVAFCDMKEVLRQVDVCICSAEAPHFLIGKDVVERVMLLRENKKLVFIDISMPRNIDPRVAEIASVLLYQLDDLNEVVDSNMKMREAAVDEVRTIINSKIIEYNEKLKKLSPFEEFDTSGVERLYH